MNTDEINLALEKRGWYFQESFLDGGLCDVICETFIDKAKPKSFITAKVGRGIKKSSNKSIRKSSIRWITDWDENESLTELQNIFTQIMTSTKDYFRIPLKRFESQIAVYNNGGFYRTHLDQHPKSRHRQISCCLYLNDCQDGGELVLYKKGSRTESDMVVKPRKGSIVLFISAEIFHEVKTVRDSRYSITTWFRDDEIVPFV